MNSPIAPALLVLLTCTTPALAFDPEELDPAPGLAALRSAAGIAVGRIRDVRTEHDRAGVPTIVVQLEVAEWVRGGAGAEVAIRVPGGKSPDGMHKVYDTNNPVYWDLLVPGLVAWFAWDDTGTVVSAPQALILTLRGKGGGSCAADRSGSVILDTEPWRRHLRHRDRSVPRTEVAVVDCSGAMAFEAVRANLEKHLDPAPPEPTR